MEWALLYKTSLLPPTGQIKGWALTESESRIKGPYPVDYPWYKNTPDQSMACGWIETNYYYNHYLCNIWAGDSSWQFLVRSYVYLTEQSLIENVNHLEDH